MKITKMSVGAFLMTIFTIGFIFIMIFTIFVGAAAMIFLSFDAQPNLTKTIATKKTTQKLYDTVRRVNTETIETVDSSGSIQQWTRLGQ